MSTDSAEPAREHPENPDLAGQLKLAIDVDDLEEVKRLMTRHPQLHRALLGSSKCPPLTWAAFGGGPPSETRLAMAQWMIENGSDIHQGDDGPLIRAMADPTFRMAELLVAHGADVNARYGGTYPLIMFPLEEFGPQASGLGLDDDSKARLLLKHGADPNARATFPQADQTIGKAATDALHDLTPVGYARRYSDRRCVNSPAIAVIEERGGKE